MSSPSISKDAKMECPEEKVEEELLGGELLADQFTVSKLAGHLGVVFSVSESLLLIVEALELNCRPRQCWNIKTRRPWVYPDTRNPLAPNNSVALLLLFFSFPKPPILRLLYVDFGTTSNWTFKEEEK